MIVIGAIAPTSYPGWREAGYHLMTGIQLAVEELNLKGGLNGQPIMLIKRDSAGNPDKASKIVEEFSKLKVTAIIGEYHSVVAYAVASKAIELGIPFLCTSAVIDNLSERKSDYIARIGQVQSRGWQLFAEFLLSKGHSKIGLATDRSAYWIAGAAILKKYLSEHSASCHLFYANDFEHPDFCNILRQNRISALLLLVGHPDPAVTLASKIKKDNRTNDIMLGAPAGQPEFSTWSDYLGADGTGIPFLRYRTGALTPLGCSVQNELRVLLEEEPSFVALEGYDGINLLAEIIRQHGTEPKIIANSWSRVRIPGTRGEISLSRDPNSGIFRWMDVPVQIVDRDPECFKKFRLLYSR